VTDYYLYQGENGPATSTVEDGAQYTLGVEFRITGTGWLKGYRVWRPADLAITGPLFARTYLVDGGGGAVVGGSDAQVPLSGAGWQQVLLSTPVPLSTSPTYYRAAVHFPNGRYSATPGYFGTSGPAAGGLVVGILNAPDSDNSTSLTQNLFTAGAALAYPASGGSSSNYWITPIITDVNPAGEVHEDDVTATLAGLSASSTGAKGGLGAAAGSLTFGGSGTALARRVAAPSVGIALASAGAGTKRGVGAATGPLALGSSATGTIAVDGLAPRSSVLCSPWALVDDVPEPHRSELSNDEWARYLLQASELLWAMTMRRFYGSGCTEVAVLRSTSLGGSWPYDRSWGSCRCWTYGTWVGDSLYPPRAWSGSHVQAPVAVRLPANGVRAVTEVLIDGVPLDPARYRLTRSGWLERTDGGTWPVCEDRTEITYAFGFAPPEGGVRAAVELAIELSRYERGLDCNLPQGVTSMSRQGISVEVANPLDFLDDGRTGIVAVDLFIRAVNPLGRAQVARVWSPDVPTTTRR
jgi:hypothetical protein